MGPAHESRKSESDLIRVAKPEWRIVSDQLWHAAHQRFRTRRATFHGGAGRPPRQQQDRESRYLLSSFARCAICGSGICTISRDSGGRRLFSFRCSANHKKGADIGANSNFVAIDSLDRAVLDALGAALFTPSVAAAVIAGVREALQPDTQAQTAQREKKDLAAVDRHIANLTEAIVLASGPLPALVATLHERQQRRDALLAALAAADSRATVDLRLIEKQVRGEARRLAQSAHPQPADCPELLP